MHHWRKDLRSDSYFSTILVNINILSQVYCGRLNFRIIMRKFWKSKKGWRITGYEILKQGE